VPTVAFDVIGTLFSLDRPRQALASRGAPPLSLELWFAQTLRDAMALAHSGGYRPFAEVLQAALQRLAPGLGLEEGDVPEVMEAFRQLDPVEGAQEALARLSEAGWRILALTNGSEQSTRALLRRAGLEERFAAARSCDEVRTTKPHPSVYAMAKEGAEGEPWLVAAHAWDVAGAARAGLRTAWISSVEGGYLSVYPEPDVITSDLRDAAHRLIERAR
jgi:2-haloacid dehalogenase